MLGSSDVGGSTLSGSHRELRVCTVGGSVGYWQRYEPVHSQYELPTTDISDEESLMYPLQNKNKKQKTKHKRNDHVLTKLKALTFEKWFLVCFYNIRFKIFILFLEF